MPSNSILRALQARILEAKPGARLPSARELAAEIGVERRKVNQAVDRLIGAGTLRREGYKLFVERPARSEQFTVHLFSPVRKHLDEAGDVVRESGGEPVPSVIAESDALRHGLLSVRKQWTAGVLTWYPRHLDLLEALERDGASVVLCGHVWAGHSHVSGDYTGQSRLAVEHLAALGHREIALVVSRPHDTQRGIVAETREGFRAACEARRLISAHRIHEVFSVRDTEAAWAALEKEPARCTAIICGTVTIAENLLSLLHRVGRAVPADLSLVALSEDPGAAHADPPLTTVAVDEEGMSRIAAWLLCQEISRRLRHPGAIKREGVICEPTLVVRGSTAAPRTPVVEKQSAPARRATKAWADDESERRRQLAKINQRRFTGIEPASCQPLDLSPYVNRGFGPRSSWLGDQPLRHFGAGRHMIHGVPFHVMKGNDPRHSAIVLRSRRARSSGGSDLPLTVDIPVSRAAKSVLFLHAAVWSVRHEPFARYEFQFEGGREEQMDVISYSRGPSTKNLASQWRKESTIQDWHPSYPLFQSARVLPYVVSKDGDPFLYERHLYVCRWMSSAPEAVLTHLRIRALQPEVRATLAVLAITLER